MRIIITTIVKAGLLLSGLMPLYATGFERSERVQFPALPDVTPVIPAPPATPAQFPQPPVTTSKTSNYDYNSAAKQQFERVFDSVHQALGKDDITTSQQHYSSTRHLTDGQVVSIEFVEANIREAFFELGNQTQIPFILEEGVQGFVSLKLYKAPLKKALEMLLVAGGYRYKEMEDYILVGMADSQNPAV